MLSKIVRGNLLRAFSASKNPVATDSAISKVIETLDPTTLDTVTDRSSIQQNREILAIERKHFALFLNEYAHSHAAFRHKSERELTPTSK
jgi:hypothetical protein